MRIQVTIISRSILIFFIREKKLKTAEDEKVKNEDEDQLCDADKVKAESELAAHKIDGLVPSDQASDSDSGSDSDFGLDSGSGSAQA